MPRRGRGRRKLSTTKEYRNDRTRRAMRYLAAAGSISAARKMAKLDRFDVNTSVWITALGKLLQASTSKRTKR